MITGVIFCGGLGTRLDSISNGVPKSLMKIQDIPVIDIIINEFFLSGVNKVYLLTGHKSYLIKEYIYKKYSKKKVICVDDKVSGAGSGSAFLGLFNTIKTEYILCSNGDTLFIMRHLLADNFKFENTLFYSKLTKKKSQYGSLSIFNNHVTLNNTQANTNFAFSGVSFFSFNDFNNFLCNHKIKLNQSIDFTKDLLTPFTLQFKFQGILLSDNFRDMGTPEMFYKLNYD